MSLLSSSLKITLFILLLLALLLVCFTLPIQQILHDFLTWVEQDLGPWGPLALAVAYIPLTILAVPASVLTIGGGYLFGLPMGIIADSIGSTAGAGAAFLLGRTIGKSFVVSRLKDYPKFRLVEIAIQRSGFKPLTVALVYVGTTLKDLSDVTHGLEQFSTSRWVFIILGIVISVILMICVTKVAKSSLDEALAECDEDIDDTTSLTDLSIEHSIEDPNHSLLYSDR
ncbi:PREDICTED: uncharacterized protein LOC109343407 isoform X2 [Lupinus angustifolius]|uniref:uncharacterized protein LOC109343407 isoform X2 n=1 Tax=Lupinus angustifolius TaxID=3871 RepID=UPI00092E778B|nr:PREDICTED: uncharacterized protein LOC109343407 isoform X2 [Lupinus angustifolius]